MTDRPGAPSLDPELIVAYAEGRLSAAEAEAVEIQLAANPDDHALLVQIMKVTDALPPERASLAEPATRSSRWWLGGAALAAAAVLVLAVLPVMRRGSSPELTRLVTAVGEARYVEPRLTGGFQFGPLRQIQRDSSQDLAKANLELYAAAAAAREAAERDPQASRLVAWGIAQVLTHEFDGAIETLQRAATADGSPQIASNLSAAYLARGIARQSQADLQAAREQAEKALSIRPDLPEALYNRALALERLGLTSEASAAWQFFLSVEPQGPWAADARLRSGHNP